MEFLTNSPNQTKKLAENLAKKFLKRKIKKKAFILGLSGDLGGGKTTFLQGFAKGLGIKEKILSPTFLIMRKFKIRVDSSSNWRGFVYFYHIDCYRIRKPKEILDLGFEKIILNPQNLVAIEWPERIKKIIPKNTIWIKFEFRDKNKRKIVIR